MIKERQPHVLFHLWSQDIRTSLAEGIEYTKILVSRYNALEPLCEIGYNYYQLAISDHSDFNGIMEYIQKSNPRLVITDRSRGRYHALLLAAEIENRLHIAPQYSHQPSIFLSYLPGGGLPYCTQVVKCPVKRVVYQFDGNSFCQLHNLFSRPDVVGQSGCHSRGSRIGIAQALVRLNEVVVHEIEGDGIHVILEFL